jgi:hypothetical protein
MAIKHFWDNQLLDQKRTVDVFVNLGDAGLNRLVQ